MIITTNLPNMNDDSINSPSSPSEYENKIMPKKKKNSIDEYIEHIEKQCEKSIKPTKKIKRN